MPLQKATVPAPPKLWTSSVPHRAVDPLLQRAWISPVLWRSWGTAPPRPWTASALQNSPAIKCSFWQWFCNACLPDDGRLLMFTVWDCKLSTNLCTISIIFLLHCKLFIWSLKTLTFFLYWTVFFNYASCSTNEVENVHSYKFLSSSFHLGL